MVQEILPWQAFSFYLTFCAPFWVQPGQNCAKPMRNKVPRFNLRDSQELFLQQRLRMLWIFAKEFCEVNVVLKWHWVRIRQTQLDRIEVHQKKPKRSKILRWYSWLPFSFHADPGIVKEAQHHQQTVTPMNSEKRILTTITQGKQELKRPCTYFCSRI